MLASPVVSRLPLIHERNFIETWKRQAYTFKSHRQMLAATRMYTEKTISTTKDGTSKMQTVKERRYR